MRPVTHNALLVIADISGFTQFMKQHAHVANDAMSVVVELLRAVIASAAAPLQLVEIEGDAAFFYAPYNNGGDNAREFAAIKKQATNFFHVFEQTQQSLRAAYPRVFGAKDLRLKVVIHAGKVAREHIHGFDKLFGMDVILAHRLLKNSVSAQEYVLLTKQAHALLGDFYDAQPAQQIEYCEGLGVVETVVFFPPAQGIFVCKKPVEKFQCADRHSLLGALRLNEARKLLLNVQSDLKSCHDRTHMPLRGSVWLPQLQTKWRRETAIHSESQSRQQPLCGTSP